MLNKIIYWTIKKYCKIRDRKNDLDVGTSSTYEPLTIAELKIAKIIGEPIENLPLVKNYRKAPKMQKPRPTMKIGRVRPDKTILPKLEINADPCNLFPKVPKKRKRRKTK